MSQTTQRTATELLRDQHNEAKRLFSEVVARDGEARGDAFQCLVRLLAVHETAEEEVVYPVLTKAAPDGEELANARRAEEDAAKDELSQLEKLGTDSPDFEGKFKTFRDAVLHHADQEEQLVFPRLEKYKDADELEKMAKALETAEAMAPTHPHPHGPESAIGNMIVGPFVAIADRVRDALRSKS